MRCCQVSIWQCSHSHASLMRRIWKIKGHKKDTERLNILHPPTGARAHECRYSLSLCVCGGNFGNPICDIPESDTRKRQLWEATVKLLPNTWLVWRPSIRLGVSLPGAIHRIHYFQQSQNLQRNPPQSRTPCSP